MKPPNPLTLTDQEKRKHGAYFTPDSAAVLMAQWVMAHKPGVVLEPSFGDGAFLRALEVAVGRRKKPTVVGAELLSAAFDAAAQSFSLPLRGHAGDFLSLPKQPVDAVIGNPPFVRLRHLPSDQRAAALRSAADALGHPMDPSGSTWMPFVLHSSEHLNDGGCLALVLPHELTYVKYALPLWKYLGQTFGRLRVVRTFDRMFGDLLQDVVILLAEEKGGTCEVVEYQVSSSLHSLEEPGDSTVLSLSEIAAGKRNFHHALLSPDILRLVKGKLSDATVELGDTARIRIGYVAGEKRFFHPDRATVKAHRIPERSLRKSFGAGRSLRGHGLLSSKLPGTSTQSLWLPDPNKLTKGERDYIEYGETTGVSSGYKCSVRSPWYVVPGVETPDAIFSVFSDRPLVILNDAGLVASNSLLCAYLNSEHSREWLVGAWYSSITQLFIEMEVHSLGGGVLVAVPNELSRVRVPRLAAASRQHVARVHKALLEDDYVGACALGDSYLLEQGVISQRDLRLIKEGIATLQKWRNRRVS